MRVRNAQSGPLKLRLWVAPRSFSTSGANAQFPQVAAGCAGFTAAPDAIELQPGAAADVQITFSPDSAEYILHAAKLMM